VFPRNRGFPFLSDLGLVFDDHATVTGDLLRICLLAPMAATYHCIGLQRPSLTVDTAPEACGEVVAQTPCLGLRLLSESHRSKAADLRKQVRATLRLPAGFFPTLAKRLRSECREISAVGPARKGSGRESSNPFLEIAFAPACEKPLCQAC